MTRSLFVYHLWNMHTVLNFLYALLYDCANSQQIYKADEVSTEVIALQYNCGENS